jgi:hypothetical protein
MGLWPRPEERVLSPFCTCVAEANIDQLTLVCDPYAMSETERLKYLRLALVLVGVTFIVGIYILMIAWPSGWKWHTGHSDYPMMIVGVYATLGLFLLLAARDPLKHLSLIWFTIWSSVVHGGIMAVQAMAPDSHGHWMGDVPALIIVAIVLAILTPRKTAT